MKIFKFIILKTKVILSILLSSQKTESETKPKIVHATLLNLDLKKLN